VCLCCLDADVQYLGHLARRVPLGDKLQHFALAIGELFVTVLNDRRFSVASVLYDFFGDCWAQKRVAAINSSGAARLTTYPAAPAR
jgi:hypothetical protein